MAQTQNIKDKLERGATKTQSRKTNETHPSGSLYPPTGRRNHTILRKIASGLVKVNEPHDKYEKEADSTAEKALAKADERQPLRTSVKHTTPRRDLPTAAPSLSGGGRPLGMSLRSFLEPRFSAELDPVRVHTGDEAARLCQILNAHAFTHGGDIYFARGAYEPYSSSGRRLFYHELAHTIQHPHDPNLVRRNERETVQREGQVQERGGIKLIGPAITLDSDLTSTVAGHLSLNWILWHGRPDSGEEVSRGRFIAGGVVEEYLATGEEYTLQLTGTVSVYESNLIFNDAYNGVRTTATWLIRPREQSAQNDEDALELIGEPTVQPLSSLLTPTESDWNIVVQDITRPRSDSAQAGLSIRWTKSSSETTGYGGSAGGGSVSSSESVTRGKVGVLSTLVRFEFVTITIGEARVISEPEGR